MRALPGFNSIRVIHETDRSIVVNARMEGTRADVVVKMPSDERSTASSLASFRAEAIVLREVGEVAGVRLIDERRITGRPALVLSRHPGENLHHWIKRDDVTVADWLAVAEAAARRLHAVHSQGVIHKDLSPANILWDRASGDVALIDFGTATTLEREFAPDDVSWRIRGTLGYLAPEITGRVDRHVDYRADLYSLGATLFHAFVGEPVFPGSSPEALLHAHVAKRPPSAHHINPTVPEAVSRILACLLEKAAGNRYQSALALADDFARCRTLWDANGDVPAFDLTTFAADARFVIPQRIYGRDQELQQLSECFDRVRRGARELAVVSGSGGCGKTALIMALRRQVVERDGIFGVGKFEQVHRGKPFYALIAALSPILQRILLDTDSRIDDWRSRFEASLGDAGCAVVAQVIPEFARLAGTTDPPPPLPAADARRRLQHYFELFFRCFCATGTPLVLLLDDLQWSDAASLRLTSRILLDPAAQGFLLIASYRSNEVGDDHPVAVALSQLYRDGVPSHHVSVGPLDTDAIAELVADTLRQPKDQVRDLAKQIADKTAGNAHFVHELLRALHSSELVRFDTTSRAWRAEANAVTRLALQRGSVGLILDRFEALSERAQRLVQIASCLGGTTDLRLLALAAGQPLDEVATEIRPALVASLLILVGEGRELLRRTQNDESASPILVKFPHDRVQTAVYDEMTHGDARALHYQIGTRLARALDATPNHGVFDVFDVVDQLNHGVSLVTDAATRRDISRRNLVAAHTAMDKSSFETAFRLYRRGLYALPADDEGTDPWLALHQGALEAAFGAGYYDEIDAHAERILDHSSDADERSAVHRIRISSLNIQARFGESLAEGIATLRSSGIHVPEKPGVPTVLFEAARQRILHHATPGWLRALPRMTDPAARRTASVLYALFPPAFQGRPLLFPLLLFRLGRLHAAHGLDSRGYYTAVLWAIVHVELFQDFDSAEGFLEASRELLAHRGPDDPVGPTRTIMHHLSAHWFLPYRDLVHELDRAFETCMAEGDHEYAGYATLGPVQFYAHIFGTPDLYALKRQLERLVAINEAALGCRPTANYHRVHLQWTANLLGETDEPTCVEGTYYDDAEHGDPQPGGSYHRATKALMEISLALWLEDHAKTRRLTQHLDKDLEGYHWASPHPIAVWQSALLLVQTALTTADNRRRHVRMATRLKRKIDAWAARNPANFEAPAQVLHAALLAVRGRRWDALQAFDTAMTTCVARGFVPLEALAARMCAHFLSSASMDDLARPYAERAAAILEGWGAIEPLRRLREQYENLEPPAPHLAQTAGHARTPGSRPSQPSTTELSSLAMDIGRVFSAIDAISRELKWDRLLRSVTASVVELAAATRGAIVLRTKGQMLLVAVGSSDENHVEIDRSRPLDEAGDQLPITVVREVLRTGEVLTNERAGWPLHVDADPYLKARADLHVLCVPIGHRGETLGAMYLENELVTAAFTPMRIELLQLIATHVGVSFQNANMVETLEFKVAQRSAELEESHRRLLETAHLAGKAEVASSALHNIGNALTGVSVPASLAKGRLEASPTVRLVGQLHTMFRDADTPLAKTVREDLQYPALLRMLAGLESLATEERAAFSRNLTDLQRNLEHVQAVLRAQLSYVRVGQLQDRVTLAEVVSDSIALLENDLRRTAIRVTQRVEPMPETYAPKHLMMTILVNLIRNASDAMQDAWTRDGHIEVSAVPTAAGVRVTVEDNGPGVPEEAEENLFEWGFTTKDLGHGIGLHSACIAAADLGGTLTYERPESGVGARFVLSLPIATAPKKSH